MKGYYISDKEKSLFKAYERLNENSELEEEELEIEFETICSTNNIDAVIIDESGKQAMSTVHDTHGLMLQLFDYLVNKNAPGVVILEKTDNYTFQKVRDKRVDLEYLEMWGYLNDGKLFIMRIPVESIKESVGIANRFLAYVGIIAIVISGCLIWLVSKKITEPILELADIS